MFIEQSVDEQYKDFCTEILEPTFKKIALSFSVSTSEFYDTIHELTFSPERLMSEQARALGVDLDFEDIQGYDRLLETEKSKQRLYRIAQRLTFNPDEKRLLNTEILLEPKIYDEHIYEAMAKSYGSISDSIGDVLFRKLNHTNVVRALQIENRKEENDKVFFTFSEFIMYTCLYMALNRSSVTVLNKYTDTVNYKKRLKGRMQKIKHFLYSEQFRYATVRTLLDLFAKYNEEKYHLLLEKHLREHWLPEAKRHMKYFDYADKKNYFLKSPRITYRGKELFNNDENLIKESAGNVRLMKLLYNKYEDDEYERVQSFVLEYSQVQIYEEFFYNVLPVVTMISEGIVPKGLVKTNEQVHGIELYQHIVNSSKLDRITKEHIKRSNAQEYTVHPNTYRVAEKLCEIIDTYIDAVICSVVNFLEYLPESKIKGEKNLLEYFKDI